MKLHVVFKVMLQTIMHLNLGPIILVISAQITCNNLVTNTYWLWLH